MGILVYVQTTLIYLSPVEESYLNSINSSDHELKKVHVITLLMKLAALFPQSQINNTSFVYCLVESNVSRTKSLI